MYWQIRARSIRVNTWHAFFYQERDDEQTHPERVTPSCQAHHQTGQGDQTGNSTVCTQDEGFPKEQDKDASQQGVPEPPAPMQQDTGILGKDETAQFEGQNEYPRQAAMKRPLHRREGGIERQPGANQAQTTDALDQWKPNGSVPWGKAPRPSESRENQEDAEDDDGDLLHPAKRAKAQCSQRLYQGIEAGLRDAFQQRGQGKEKRSNGPTTDQPKREWGPQALLQTCESVRSRGSREWFKDLLHKDVLSLYVCAQHHQNILLSAIFYYSR